MALRSALFASQVEGADALRGGPLAIAALSFPNLSGLPDTYLFGKLVAAEGEVSRRLGVPLGPTHIFTDQPSDAQILALGGEPYLIEPGYDLTPDFLSVQKWGYLVLRQRPVISVSDLRMVYPNVNGQDFVIPLNWLRIDHDYGRLNILPTSSLALIPINIIALQAIVSGNTIPNMIRVRYVAGLRESSPYYAEARDIVLRLAVCRMLGDAMLPGSESISADGLSQSRSVDTSKLEAGIEAQIAALAQKITGPVFGVL